MLNFIKFLYKVTIVFLFFCCASYPYLLSQCLPVKPSDFVFFKTLGSIASFLGGEVCRGVPPPLLCCYLIKSVRVSKARTVKMSSVLVRSTCFCKACKSIKDKQKSTDPVYYFILIIMIQFLF